MKLGLSLSFAAKRWQSSEYLAKLVENEIGVRYIQITWDLIDPWWPEGARDRLAGRYRDSFEKEGLKIVSSFGGLANYTYPQLLSKEKDIPEVSFSYFKRTINLTSALGVHVLGRPLGGMSDEDFKNPEARERLYAEAVGYLVRISRYAGHAVFEPLFKQRASVDIWIEQCAEYVDSYHLRQTDGQLDCHRSFSRKGLFTEGVIKRLCANPRVPSDTIGFLADFPV